MVHFFTFPFPHVLLLLLPGVAQISFALSQLLLRSYVTAAMKIILFVKKWHFQRGKNIPCLSLSNQFTGKKNVLSRIFSQQHCFINTFPYCNTDGLNKYYFICFYVLLNLYITKRILNIAPLQSKVLFTLQFIWRWQILSNHKIPVQALVW